eukprot:6182432-Pleurochrysis_carterae.AAC.2
MEPSLNLMAWRLKDRLRFLLSMVVAPPAHCLPSRGLRFTQEAAGSAMHQLVHLMPFPCLRCLELSDKKPLVARLATPLRSYVIIHVSCKLHLVPRTIINCRFLLLSSTSVSVSTGSP